MGDVGPVAKLLSEALDVFVNPNKYEEWSREKKLLWLTRGMNDAIAKNDRANADILFLAYRELYGETGP